MIYALFVRMSPFLAICTSWLKNGQTSFKFFLVVHKNSETLGNMCRFHEYFVGMARCGCALRKAFLLVSSGTCIVD